jgi:type I restriction enzyme, S subunit
LLLKNLLISPLANGIFKKQDFYGRGVRLVNVYDLYQDTEINISTLERIEITDKELEQFQVQEGDLFFCRSSLKPEGVAWTAYINEVAEPTVFECHLVRVQPNPLQAIPAYLSYYCKSSLARDYLMARASVTTMATIDQPAIESLPVILPPIEIQRSLVAEIEAARQTRKQKLEQADALFASTDTHFLEQLGIKLSVKPGFANAQCFGVKRRNVGIRLDPFYSFPEHQVLEAALSSCLFRVLAIGDKRVVREIVEGRITPKPEFYSEESEDPIFLRAQNIEKGYLNLSDAKRLNKDAFDAESKAILIDGDIVLTIDGALLGIAAVYRSGDEDCCISNHMVRIRHGIKTDPEYLSWFLNSSAGQRQIKRGITGSAIPGIRTDAIERILVPIPPLDIQRSIVIEIEKRRADAQRLRQKAEAEWEAAKTRFERQLLGEVDS